MVKPNQQAMLFQNEMSVMRVALEETLKKVSKLVTEKQELLAINFVISRRNDS